MPRVATGTIYESPKGSGNWSGRFTVATKRRSVRFPICRTRRDAERHRDFISEQHTRLRQAKQLQFADKLFELASLAKPSGLARVKHGVAQIVAGNFVEPPAVEAPDASTTDAEPTVESLGER